MQKIINCLKEKNHIINKVAKKVSVNDGLKIATELFEILNKQKTAIGLAAPQVGIDAQVAVLNVREPLILINPVIKEQWEEIDYYEGCLSFPKKGVHTKRYKNIIIHTEQEESNWYFSGVPTDGGKGSWEQENKDDKESRLLEAVCIQHEIDHLNGITCMDIGYKSKPIKSDKRYTRNEIVGITDGEIYKELKWKKALPLIKSGKWEVYVGGPVT
jgi:peptide deformylase